MHLKAQVLKEFCVLYPSTVHRMRNCLHSYDDSLSGLNPFHLEGDVWSHTMMVLKQLTVESNREDVRRMMYDLCLLHDVGKIFTRCCFSPKVGFRDHGPAGVQFAIDYIYNKYPDPVTRQIALNTILPIVSNHIDYYKSTTEEELFKLSNYNGDLFNKFSDFVAADHEGRFHTNNKEYLINVNLDNMNTDYQVVSDKYTPSDFVIYSGVPGSGKDTLAKDCTILSYDDIRVEHFKNNHKNTDLEGKELYEAAFSYCRKKGLDYKKSLIAKIQAASQTSSCKKIAICATMLHRKARVALIKSIRKIYRGRVIKIESAFIAMPILRAIHNDANRDDKCVGSDVIEKFAGHMCVPSMIEGFDEVNIIQNNF